MVFINQNGRPDEKQRQQDCSYEATIHIVRGSRSTWVCDLCVPMRINKERSQTLVIFREVLAYGFARLRTFP